MEWEGHSSCEHELEGCRFDNFSGSSEQITPYLLENEELDQTLLLFHHGEELYAWRLGVPWTETNKVVHVRLTGKQFNLRL